MVEELSMLMKTRFERQSLCLTIPGAFEQLKVEDAQIEMVTSHSVH